LFYLPIREKNGLIKEGYEAAKFYNHIDKKTDKEDNILTKKFEDTLVAFVFQKDSLNSVSVRVKGNFTDTNEINRFFLSKGFIKQKTLYPLAKLAFLDPYLRYHYDVYLQQKGITLIHNFKNTSVESKPVDTTFSTPK
jgi:hypothetical protein